MTKYGEVLGMCREDATPNVGDIVSINGNDYLVVNTTRCNDAIIVVEAWKDVNGREDY